MEENNFGIRKRLLEYDDVMNIQREAIYKKRFNALSGERLSLDLNYMFLSLTESMAMSYRAQGNYQSFRQESMRILGMDPHEFLPEDLFITGNEDKVIGTFQQHFFERYNLREKHLIEVLLPVIRDVHTNEGHRYKRIAIPFTDGSPGKLPIAADLEQAIQSEGRSIMRDIEKAVTLAIIDEEWKEHLRSMDELKESVQSASFEQKDPLVVYKMEAYELFEQLVYRINERTTAFLARGTLLLGDGRTLEEARQQKSNVSKLSTNKAPETEHQQRARRASAAAGRGPVKVETVVREAKKVGRNDPCPCGSGKKYKQCHGKG